MSKTPELKQLLDVFEMALESFVLFGEIFDDLVVLEDHLFDVKDGLLVEGFFQSFSVRSFMPRGFSFSLILRVQRLIGLCLNV